LADDKSIDSHIFLTKENSCNIFSQL